MNEFKNWVKNIETLREYNKNLDMSKKDWTNKDWTADYYAMQIGWDTNSEGIFFRYINYKDDEDEYYDLEGEALTKKLDEIFNTPEEAQHFLELTEIYVKGETDLY